jgi:predicted RNase H-like nuclease
VAGADGCKAGWVVVLREVSSRSIRVELVARIADILRWKEPPKVLCIDIPIGLLDRAVAGGRECDRAARALLGRPRGSSVFSPPARGALKAGAYEEADRRNRATGPDAPGLSRQGVALFPKIREVDQLLGRSRRLRIVEAHPEVCFYEMNGHAPVVEPKRRLAGRERRIQLLEKAWRAKPLPILGARPRGVAPDDVLDAMAACWTAERVLRGREIRVPARPPRDSRGLRMEIVR